jgi:hypothetical protein
MFPERYFCDEPGTGSPKTHAKHKQQDNPVLHDPDNELTKNGGQILNHVATSGEPLCIVRNFGMRKFLLSRPTRSDQYIAWPGEVILTTTAMTAIGKTTIIIIINAMVKSKQRFI